jgi:hypothetical protein
MTDPSVLMLRAARALVRSVAVSVHSAVEVSRLAAPIAQQAALVASASRSLVARSRDGVYDLEPMVQSGATRLRLGSESLVSFVDIVEGSRIVADLALQALADAEEFATNGTPLPGISAAAMFQALWEQGSRWDDEALVLCAEFCTLVDLVELCGAAALTCASDGLSPAVSETVIVCLEENPRQPLLDVRNAVISTLK